MHTVCVPLALHPRPGPARRWVAAATLVAALAGCSSSDIVDDGIVGGTDAPDPAVVADSNLPDPAEHASNGEPVEEPGFVQVDANTATTAELVAAFDANGIADGATWAETVIANRPYGPARPSGSEFDQLREVLADAGLDELEAEAIIASLTV